MKLFDDSSFDLVHALLALRRCSQEVNWSESSCLGWFPCSFTEGVAERDGARAVLGRKRGTDGEFLPSGNLPEMDITWLSEDYFRYKDAVSAMARYHGMVLSTQASDPGLPTMSSDYYVD